MYQKKVVSNVKGPDYLYSSKKGSLKITSREWVKNDRLPHCNISVLLYILPITKKGIILDVNENLGDQLNISFVNTIPILTEIFSHPANYPGNTYKCHYSVKPEDR